MSPNEKLLADLDIAAKMKLDSIARMKTSPGTANIPFKREIVWKNVAVYVIGHLMAAYGLYCTFFITWSELIVGYIIGILISAVGTQVGAHRYYAHRCFKATRTMQAILLLVQTMTSQNCMWVWVRDHRQHHKYSDTDADPHNARNGFFFSHVGWLLTKKHPQVIEKGKGIDMSDLNADPLIMFQKRYYTPLWFLFSVFIPITLVSSVWGNPLQAFFTWVAWRVVLTLNLTWLVNSWAHLYGDRPYDKDILPVEVSYIGMLLFGEGWHNYHHTFPWDYKASELGKPYNLGYYCIRFFYNLGMIYDLKEATDEMIISRSKKTGDGAPILAKPIVHRQG